MWTIGKLAKKANVTPRTIRYYEELALIKPLERGENRFRYYDQSHLFRLSTIKLLQKMGFGLKDISQALEPFTDANGKPSPTGQEMAEKISGSLIEVKKDLLSQREEIDTALQGIEEMAPSLKTCMECSEANSLEDCLSCKRDGSQLVRDSAHAWAVVDTAQAG